MANNVLVTGASGFVGKRLCDRLQGQSLVVVGRSVPENECTFFKKQINGTECYREALRGVDVVIHLAAKVHVMKNLELDIDEYKEINVRGTANLARQAAISGVKRFIFLSSIKVNGELTKGKPFVESDDILSSYDPYGLSKVEAESELLSISSDTGLDVVIIRPPLIYGPSVKGNFALIVKAVKNNIPLPFGAITANQRSLVALDNLIDFVLLCKSYEKTPQAANQVFLICDDEVVSTSELFRKVAKAYNKKSMLYFVPIWLLRFCAALLGKKGASERLLGSLHLNSAKARILLGWKPVVTMDEQLEQMAIADKG